MVLTENCSIKYARTHNVPFLGLCLGMQLLLLNLPEMSSVTMMHTACELDPEHYSSGYPYHAGSDGIEDIGGTLRLGAYPCVLDKTSKAYELYGTDEISERHRHRYEVNNDYRDALTKTA